MNQFPELSKILLRRIGRLFEISLTYLDRNARQGNCLRPVESKPREVLTATRLNMPGGGGRQTHAARVKIFQLGTQE